jgi:hypothetical protein
MLTFLTTATKGRETDAVPLLAYRVHFFRGNVGMLLFSAGMLVRVEILLSTCRHSCRDRN